MGLEEAAFDAFDDRLPLSLLPDEIADQFRFEAMTWLREMSEWYCDNTAVISNGPDRKQKHSLNKNPAWYSELYWSEGLRRTLTVRSLSRIATGRDLPSGPHSHAGSSRYDRILRAALYDAMTNGREIRAGPYTEFERADPEQRRTLIAHFGRSHDEEPAAAYAARRAPVPRNPITGYAASGADD